MSDLGQLLEIQWRIQCARAYPTEGQIGRAVADFATWWDLIQANFPPSPADLQEPQIGKALADFVHCNCLDGSG